MAINLQGLVGDYVVLNFEGNLTIWDMSTLEDYFTAIAKNNVHLIAIDFSKIKYMHTSLIGPIVKMQSTLEPTGGRIVLIGMSSDIRSIFTVSKLDQDFDFFESIEDLNQTQSNTQKVHINHKNISQTKPVQYSN